MKTIRRPACLVLALFFALAGCAAPLPGSSAPTSAAASTPQASPAPAGGASTPPEDHTTIDPADYDHIEPWRVAYYQAAAEAVIGGTQELTPKVVRFYTPPQGIPYMQIDYYDAGISPYDMATHSQIWHYKEQTAILLYDGTAFINSRFVPLGYFHLVNETPIYSNDNRDEPDYVELGGLHGNTRILHDILPEEAVPYDDALNLTGSELKLDTSAQLQMLADYFLDSYQPPAPGEAPEWITVYMQYIHSHTPATYAQATVQDFGWSPVLYLTTLPGETMPPAMYCTIPLVFQQHGMHHWMPDGQLQTLVGHHDGMYWFFVDATGELLLDFHVVGGRRWYRPTSDGLVFLFDGGTFHEDINGFFYVHHDGLYEQFETREAARRRNDEILAAGFTAHGYIQPVEYIEPVQYPLPENTTWPELEAALIDAFCQHAKDTGQWEGA